MPAYRVLVGKHVEGRQQDSTNLMIAERDLKNGKITKEQFNEITKDLQPYKEYGPGDVVHTDVDLMGLNGPYPMQAKFALADQPVIINQGDGTSRPMPFAGMQQPPVPVDDSRDKYQDSQDTLDSMSVKELTAFAKSEGIDTTGLQTKQQLVTRIREAAAVVA